MWRAEEAGRTARCRSAPAGLLAPALVVVGLAACEPAPPARVFVPAPSFRLTLEARTSGGATPIVGVDEPLTLFVRRTSGPWMEVGGEAATPGGCWWVRPPPPVEPEVAGNVRWLVEPAGAAEFNTGFRPDGTREVRFGRPGAYLLIAAEAGACSERADTLRVRVIAAGSAETAQRPDCIRGGSTPDEVRAVMGEPDSVSFGAWMYGRSAVAFGYGTVVDLVDTDGNLIVC